MYAKNDSKKLNLYINDYIFVTVLQCLNRNGVQCLIPYGKSNVAKPEPNGVSPFIPSTKSGCCNC